MFYQGNYRCYTAQTPISKQTLLFTMQLWIVMEYNFCQEELQNIFLYTYGINSDCMLFNFKYSKPEEVKILFMC